MGDTNDKSFRIGTRKSELALIQTNYVIKKLQTLYPTYKYEIGTVKINTLGDKILDKPLPKIGEKSLFTKELEEALENGTVDFVVHSLKDLPTILPTKKVIGAILEREDPKDCLILHEKHKQCTLKTLPEGSVIGTSSLRRTAQLSAQYPHLKICNIRGNLNTRLRKLNENGTYDGIILASAGIKRIGWSDKISEFLDENDMLYAVGQGALAVECQEQNTELLKLLEPLVHPGTVFTVLAERSFLRKLEGGCSAPVAVNSSMEGNNLALTGLISSLNGKEVIKDRMECILSNKFTSNVRDCADTVGEPGEPSKKRICKEKLQFCGIYSGNIREEDLEKAEKLGIDLAVQLINRGALKIMKEARQNILKDMSDDNKS